MMLWHICVRKGKVFIPSVAKTDAGFFMDVDPVAVHPLEDISTLVTAIAAKIANGNALVATPTRMTFPKPVVLEYANVKTWTTFEKSAQCWNITLKDGRYLICPTRRNATGGWEDDVERTETFDHLATPHLVAERVVKLLRNAC